WVLQRQFALDAGVAGHAVEIVVEAQRPALIALDHADRGADLVGGHDAPRRRLLETVEQAGGKCLLGRGREGGQAQQHHQDRVAHAHQPFTLPSSSPSMYQRCSSRNSSSTGNTVTTAPAIIISTSMMCSRDSAASATGNVYCCCSARMIRGHMKSFQAAMKLKIASVTSTGFSIGSTTCRKIRSSPAPSMRAAS